MNQRRAIKMTVAEVKAIVASIREATVSRHLSGKQRQLLASSIDELTRILAKRGNGRTVRVPIETVRRILRTIGAVLDWAGEVFHDFSTDDSNDG